MPQPHNHASPMKYRFGGIKTKSSARWPQPPHQEAGGSAELHKMEKPEKPEAPKTVAMVYVCGECHTENEMKPRDPVRCRSCGYRILYKKRTTRLIVFDAR
ncbi:DNA-directed RNA polymerases I, II, and III subunit RPABC4 [Portunus trituberculatus]|uniref:DNA-directed RNA polymerases I, II, and III subunit RPABC4 n=1 Tax=Portunus trituberculatus TaxID=210409 RepID=A0A5B7D2J4_PORTR|nr:DNA-directed RNA polymerases I, II, and III subunit RPABC4 [Portunus trituberculatus]